MADGLTDKQRAFVFSYTTMTKPNKTRAAIEAGYSPKTAEQQGNRLYRNVKVRAEINKRMNKKQAKAEEKFGITQERVLQELASIAFTNIEDVVDFDSGAIKDGADRNNLRAVSGVKVRLTPSGTETEVKFNDKLKALEMLCKNLGMFEKNNKITVEGEQSGVIELAPVMKPLKPPEEDDDE